MASTATVLKGLAAQLAAAPGLPSSPALALAPGWPAEATLMKVAQGAVGPLASVYDAGASKNTTRWHPIPAAPDTSVTPTTTALANKTVIPARGTATITIGGTPQAGDGVTVGAASNLQDGQAAGYTATSSDTVNTIATALAAAINADAALAAIVSASASGAVVTITNQLGVPVQLQLGVANSGTRTIEWKRLTRMVRVILWTNSELLRESYGDPIDSLLAQLYAQYGFQLGNGEWVRMAYDRDGYVEDQQLQDLYRRDFFLQLEYGVTGTETLWPVTATEFGLQVTGA